MRFVSIVVVMLLAACVAGCEQQSAQAGVVATPVNHAQPRVVWNTDPNRAVGIATALIREQGFEPDQYEMAGASFDAARGEWRISFPHESDQFEFDAMTVIVNDDDQSARIATD